MSMHVRVSVGTVASATLYVTAGLEIPNGTLELLTLVKMEKE
jgi:hypothetical protein